MSGKGIGNLLGKSWHSFDITVWCAVITFGAILVAKESSLTSTTETKCQKKNSETKNSRETSESVGANSVGSAVVESLCTLVSDAGTIVVEGVGIVVADTLEGTLQVDTVRALVTVIKASFAFIDVNKGRSGSNQNHFETWIWSADMTRRNVMTA